MGLSLLNSMPDQQTEIRRLQQELFARNRQLADAEDALRKEKQKTEVIESGVQQLRAVLTPLYKALQHIFGEIEEMGIGNASSVAPKHAAIWEDWKQKMPGNPAKAIDALLLHGAMTQTQLRIHVGCATGSVSDLVYKLNKAGIINKNGGKISLKEL